MPPDQNNGRAAPFVLNPTFQQQESQAERPTNFMGLLQLLLGSQQQQLDSKLAALQTPQEKMVRRDLSGRAYGPNNPELSGLDAFFAANPGADRFTYEQRQELRGRDQQNFMRQKQMEQQAGLMAIANEMNQQAGTFEDAGGFQFDPRILPVNPFAMNPQAPTAPKKPKNGPYLGGQKNNPYGPNWK